MALSGECAHSLLCCGILSCAEHLYGSSMVESLTRQEQQWACCCYEWFSSHEVLAKYPAKFCLVVPFPSWMSAGPFCISLYCMILFYCEISHHGTSVKVQHGRFGSWCSLWMYQLWLLVGSSSISEAEIGDAGYNFTSAFISFLVAYSSLLAAAVLCLMPIPCLPSWSVVMLALLILCIRFF